MLTLLISRLRSAGNGKWRKDLCQAPIPIAVLAQTAPGAFGRLRWAALGSAGHKLLPPNADQLPSKACASGKK